jgi:hypothetical protein
VNIKAYHRQQKQLSAAQSAWDNMSPDEDEEPEVIDDEPDEPGFDGILGEG